MPVCSVCSSKYKTPVCQACAEKFLPPEKEAELLGQVISGELGKEEFIRRTHRNRNYLNRLLNENGIGRFTHTYLPGSGYVSLKDPEFWGRAWSDFTTLSNASFAKKYGPLARMKRIFGEIGFKSTKETSNLKRALTCVERFGKESPMQNPDVQEKRRQANLKAYGVDNYFKQPGIQQKIKDIVRSRYGVDHPSNLETTRLKISRSHLEPNEDAKSKGLAEKGYRGVTPRVGGVYTGHATYRVQHTCGRVFDSLVLRVPRCPDCFPNSVSSFQQLYLDYLRSEFPGLEIEVNRTFKTPNSSFELDIYLPHLNVGLELNGLVFHSIHKLFTRRILPSYHLTKTNSARELGIKLIHIWEHQDHKLVQSRLGHLLGSSTRAHTRKMNLERISYSQSKDFFNRNHLHGSPSNLGSSWGLINSDGEILAALSFRPILDGQEVVRFAVRQGFSAPGSLGKLLRAVPSGPIYSYVDTDWTPIYEDSTYAKNGFKLLRHTGPSLFYTDFTSVWSRQRFQKSRLQKLFPDLFDPGLSANEILERARIFPLYTTGSWFCRKDV